MNWRETLKIPEGRIISNEANDLIFKLCTDSEKRLDADGIKSHAFFRDFDFGLNLRRSKAPYIPQIQYPTDTSNFEPIDKTALAERKARINEMHRNYQPTQKKIKYDQFSNDFLNASVNPMLYEFTFRRFFDETNSMDNLFRYDDENSEFSSFMKKMSTSKQNLDSDEIMRDNDQSENVEQSNTAVNKLSPSLISMMASVTTNSQNNNQETNRNYQPAYNNENYTNEQPNKLNKMYHLKETKSDYSFKEKINSSSDSPLSKFISGDKENSFRNSPGNLNSTSESNFIKTHHEGLKESSKPSDSNQTAPIFV